jgi:superfamily II DNA or RNA helicase
MNVCLTLDNAKCLYEGPREIRLQLRDVLSYDVEEAPHIAWRNPKWKWDGKKRLLRTLRNGNATFPTGLLQPVVKYLKENSITFKLKDRRGTKPGRDKEYSHLMPKDPRYYQDDIVGATDTRARGVIILGTGGGKTYASTLMVERKGVETLYVTPDTGLREQAVEDFKECFDEKLISTKVKSGAPIVIANVQSLTKLEEEDFQRFRMLITDEFHHSAAKTYITLNHNCGNAYFRYGMTGTFTRPDGRDMEMHGVISNVIYTKTTSELIEEDFLVRPYITFLRYQVKGYSRFNYRDAYDEIIKNNEFNSTFANIAQRKSQEEEKQTLVLVRRKDHGEFLNLLIGGGSKFIHCLIATKVFGEGQDIPTIDALVNMRLQKTEIETKQGVGRALRKAEGKDRCEVFEPLIIGHKYLTPHSIERLNTYRSEPAFRIRVVRNFS